MNSVKLDPIFYLRKPIINEYDVSMYVLSSTNTFYYNQMYNNFRELDPSDISDIQYFINPYSLLYEPTTMHFTLKEVYKEEYYCVWECIQRFKLNQVSINDLNVITDEIIKSTLSANLLYISRTSDSFDEYFKKLIKSVDDILSGRRYQNVILKMKELNSKPILDVVFLLTSLFEEVHIIKPSISNWLSTDRYLVLKSFKCSAEDSEEIGATLKQITKVCCLYKNLPVSFTNLIEESNVLICHKTLNVYNQINHQINIKNQRQMTLLKSV